MRYFPLVCRRASETGPGAVDVLVMQDHWAYLLNYIDRQQTARKTILNPKTIRGLRAKSRTSQRLISLRQAFVESLMYFSINIAQCSPFACYPLRAIRNLITESRDMPNMSGLLQKLLGGQPSASPIPSPEDAGACRSQSLVR